MQLSDADVEKLELEDQCLRLHRGPVPTSEQMGGDQWAETFWNPETIPRFCDGQRLSNCQASLREITSEPLSVNLRMDIVLSDRLPASIP